MGGGGKKFDDSPTHYTIPGTVYKADYYEFMNANADNDAFHDYYDKNHTLRPLYEEAQLVRFRELQDLEEDKEPLTMDEAYEVIDTMEGTYQWFTNEDSGVKPKLYQQIMERNDILHAAWSMAYRNYLNEAKLKGEDTLSYKRWLKTPITVWRGGNHKFIDDDVFVSYSTNQKVAEAFARQRGDDIRSLKIRPIDTYGQYSNIGELEYFIPRRNVK